MNGGQHRTTALAFARGYRVDEAGRVISPSGKERAVHWERRGNGGLEYGRVSLRTDDGWRSFQIHKLAAYQQWGDAAFAPGVVVRHLNGRSTDNRPSNLALGTQSENMLDRSAEDLRAHALKAAAASRLLSGSHVRELVAMRRAGLSLKACAVRFGVGKSTVSEIMSGKLYSELSGIPFAARKAVA